MAILNLSTMPPDCGCIKVYKSIYKSIALVLSLSINLHNLLNTVEVKYVPWLELICKSASYLDTYRSINVTTIVEVIWSQVR